METMTRIAFVHNTFPAGGAERITLDIARYLASFDKEYEVFAYVTRVDEEKLDALKIFIDGKNVNIEAEMVQAMEELYAKHVPVRVREYISKKNLSDPNKSSSNGNRK